MTAPTEVRPNGRDDDRWAGLPWWRRPRRIDRQFASALVVTAVLAVVTFGGLNYVAARDLLVRGTEGELAGVASARAEAVEAGSSRLIAEVSASSADLAIAQALDDLTAAFGALEEETLDEGQLAELEQWYQTRVDVLNDAGFGPISARDLVPRSAAAQWVQFHYTVRPDGEPPPIDAGDGTAYSALNARVTPFFESFADQQAGGDVLLLDNAGTIVYTLDKRNDVGTNLVVGPYADSELARVVTEALPRARVGTAVLTDFSVSPTGRAALFAVSAVRSGSEVLGALAVEVPVAVINAVTSSIGAWDDVGLRGGDVYLVGSDQTLQSEPRAWLDDPDAYLAGLRAGTEEQQAEADLIELFGSPVGIQVIGTDPVLAALDGEEFRGSARNALGEATYAASEPLDVGGQQWVVVTEVPRSAVLTPLREYLGDIVLVLVIVLPIVAALGVWLARRLTLPIRPIVAAADGIADGDRDPDLDTTGRDEFGDLARRLSAMAAALAEHERQLTAEYESTRQLLLAVLPARLVDEAGTVVGTGEAAKDATVVAVSLGPSSPDDDEGEVTEALAAAAGVIEELAEREGLQRVRSAADRYLLVAGMDTDNSGADAALAFTTGVRDELPEHTDVGLSLTIGVATGAVATGLLDTGSLTFGAWGEPVRQALALASLAQPGEVLVDASTTAAGEREWPLTPARDVVGLDGQTMPLQTLTTEPAPSQSPV